MSARDLMVRVLDHGYVRLVYATLGDLVDVDGKVVAPNGYVDFDLLVARAARTSYDAAWRAGLDQGSDSRLIHYLMRKRHTSPFECCHLTVEAKLPIFVVRQWHRHRTHAYNEVSARYSELPEEFYVPNPAVVGTQSVANKQARQLDVADPESLLMQRGNECVGMADHQRACFKAYQYMLERGWPKELARGALSVFTYTKMFDTVSLLNAFRFLQDRLNVGAQWEIRQYAKQVLAILRAIAPESTDAFEQHWLQPRSEYDL